MNCLAASLTLLVNLDGCRSVPVEIEYVQTVTPERITYDVLDASLDIGTLRTLTIFQAEDCLRMAREQFVGHCQRRSIITDTGERTIHYRTQA